MKLLPTLALLACSAAPAMVAAQNPQVLFDTDRGPIVVELDAALAPELVNNFLRYVDAGRYNGTLFERVAKRTTSSTGAVTGIDIVQGGGYDEAATPITVFETVSTQWRTGMNNNRGSLAVALPNNSQNLPNLNAVTSAFYFNVNDNTNLNSSYPTFGRVTYGLSTLDAILTTPRFTGKEQPIRPPVVSRIVRIEGEGFPILPLHTGAWFDPAKSGRGFNVEIANPAGTDDGPLLVVYWYDYFEGRQVWMTGSAPFELGATEVTVPMLITSGGQFGEAYDPAAVQTDADWGTLTVRFTACDAASFSYATAFGDGSVALRRLTTPTNASCED